MHRAGTEGSKFLWSLTPAQRGGKSMERGSSEWAGSFMPHVTSLWRSSAGKVPQWQCQGLKNLSSISRSFITSHLRDFTIILVERTTWRKVKGIVQCFQHWKIADVKKTQRVFCMVLAVFHFHWVRNWVLKYRSSNSLHTPFSSIALPNHEGGTYNLSITIC